MQTLLNVSDKYNTNISKIKLYGRGQDSGSSGINWLLSSAPMTRVTENYWE